MTETRVREIAEHYLVRVKGAGPDNIVALCPFHDDKDPSFCMNIHNGLYICFACDAKGGLRQFLTQMGLTPEQIKLNYGVTLKEVSKNQPPPPDPKKPGVFSEPSRWIPEDLLGVFNRIPPQLIDEGFTEETIRYFEVGIDQAHARVTFPLRDFNGRLVGISGRATNDKQEPRYKVYLEEYRAWELPPYTTDKGQLLWNAHRVYRQVAADAQIVIVEGFKAAMWLKQAGVENVVALMTRRMSWAQKWMLNQMGLHLTLMLDNDDPGVDGTIKVSAELIKSCQDLRIVEYDGEQPTDVPLEDVRELVESAEKYNGIVMP